MSSDDTLLVRVAASSTAPSPAASTSAVTRVFADAAAETAAVAIWSTKISVTENVPIAEVKSAPSPKLLIAVWTCEFIALTDSRTLESLITVNDVSTFAPAIASARASAAAIASEVAPSPRAATAACFSLATTSTLTSAWTCVIALSINSLLKNVDASAKPPSATSAFAVILAVTTLVTDSRARANASSAFRDVPPVSSAIADIDPNTVDTCLLAASNDLDKSLVGSASGLKSNKLCPSASWDVSIPKSFAIWSTVGGVPPVSSASSTACW